MTRKKKASKPGTQSVKVDTPEFRSEEEEARWWDQHPDLIADLLIRHGRRAALPTRAVSIRLPVTDIDKARELAGQRGLGYEMFLQILIHEALQREARPKR